jgi:Holliday junction DNA helicase RuvA
LIAHLEGVLREKAPTRVVVATGGVGYELFVSLSTHAALPDEGKTVSLRVHTHVREDAIQLFGFHTDLERALFELLLRVSGVGPKLAQAVLSGIAPAELAGALGRGDAGALCRVPGVGSKTAQRLVVELRDRVAGLVAAAETAAASKEAAAPDARLDEVVSALVNLGTARARAERVACEVLERAEAEAPLEALIRAALQRLAR